VTSRLGAHGTQPSAKRWYAGQQSSTAMTHDQNLYPPVVCFFFFKKTLYSVYKFSNIELIASPTTCAFSVLKWILKNQITGTINLLENGRASWKEQQIWGSLTISFRQQSRIIFDFITALPLVEGIYKCCATSSGLDRLLWIVIFINFWWNRVGLTLIGVWK